jgi:L-fucose mutarotase
MLKGISPYISPDLLKILAEMGHGDEIVFADAHFSANALNSRVIRADGIPTEKLLEGIIQIFELDDYAVPVIMMSPVPGDKIDPSIESSYRKALSYEGKIGLEERFDFYERTKKAYAVVITGQTKQYGNIILKKGLILDK